jgi:hypothetical protein
MIFRRDAVQGSSNGQRREHINAFEFHRIFPTFFNGREIESARAWIDAGGATP